MNSRSQHFQSLSVTILAIATAAVGFGLFGADFRVGENILETGLSSHLVRLKVIAALSVLICYSVLVVSVARILGRKEVTDGHVVNGPIRWMAMEMTYVAAIFIIRVLEEPPTD